MGSVISSIIDKVPTVGRDSVVFDPVRNVIGRGAYATVYKGTQGSRPVAIKKIHEILIEGAGSDGNLETLLLNFKREADILQTAKHPHIVKYFGIFSCQRDHLMLVMELMQQSLSQFLQHNKGTLSKRHQVSVCRQIASAIYFLHEHDPQILHRDIQPGNILLNASGTIAKLSDLGQARFCPRDKAYLATTAPGCIPYMPPEVLISNHSRFTAKSDVFSFGVVMLVTATQEHPSCGLIKKEKENEIERRAADLVLISDEHPLKSIILLCLKDEPDERPDMDVVFTLIQKYFIFQSGLLHQHAGLHVQSSYLSSMPMPTGFATACIQVNDIFLCGGTCPDYEKARIVQVYNLEADTWSMLPPSMQYNSQATVIDNQLALIGGHNSNSKNPTNLISFWEREKGWVSKHLMPTKRHRPSILKLDRFLIIAGGKAEDNKTILSTIDVLDSAANEAKTLQTLSLPQPMAAHQMVLCGSYIYICNGEDADAYPIKAAWRMSADELESAVLLELKATPKSKVPKVEWDCIKETPFYNSCLVPNTQHPMVVGGCTAQTVPTNNVFLYNVQLNNWTKVGELLTPRIDPCVITTSQNSFIVFGGYTDASSFEKAKQTLLNTVELVQIPYN